MSDVRDYLSGMIFRFLISDIWLMEAQMAVTKEKVGSKRIDSAKELKVYQKAYALAMEIFAVSKGWPQEEKYSLIDQIRRSSRAVCSNMREAWAKRRYEAHFVSKLTDCDGENSETDTWLDFSNSCGYLSDEQHRYLINECRDIGAMIGSMIKDPSVFLIKRR